MAARTLPILDNATLPVVSPSYLKEFACIGPECPDSCCKGWSVISIDPVTQRQYQAVSHPGLRTKLQQNIIEVEMADGRKDTCFKMDSRSTCPFLTKERLCEIQKELGEEYLCSTCSMYPRISNEVHGVIERSLTLSCPEAARIALLRPEGIRLEVMEVPPRWGSHISNSIPESDSPAATNMRTYYWQIRKLVLALLHDRTRQIGVRVARIGRLCRRIQDAAAADTWSTIPEIVGEMEDNFALLDDPVPTRREDAMAAQVQLLRELFQFNSRRSRLGERYGECYRDTLLGFGSSHMSTDLERKYEWAYLQYYVPFMRTHGYILENYHVNQVFKNLFPCAGNSGVWDEFVILALTHALLKMHLVGLGAFHRELTPEIAVKLIQSFVKSFEHNMGILGMLRARMEEAGTVNLENLVKLLADEKYC